MAATGNTPIQLYYSNTASNVPLSTNLIIGELAINVPDGNLFYLNESNVVKVLASVSTLNIANSAGIYANGAFAMANAAFAQANTGGGGGGGLTQAQALKLVSLRL